MSTLLVGCSPDPVTPPDPTIPPSATPSVPDPIATEPEPEPEPPPPVVGELTRTITYDLSVTGTGLYRDGTEDDRRVPIDEAAGEAAVAAAVTWVDAHLSDLQAGGPGGLEGLGLVGATELAAGALTDPDHVVSAARYAVAVGARGTPEWVRLTADVARSDGTSARAEFVFTVVGDEVVPVATAGPET